MYSPSSQSLNLPENTKFLKLDSDQSLEYFLSKQSGNKIKAIPLLFQKIGSQDGPRSIFRASVKGYKYVSRITASAEQTASTLNKTTRISCLKLVRRVDFDPYFCNTSALKPLSEVLKKLKRLLYHLTMIIRRFTMKDELRNFSLFLARSTNLKRIKIEFADPQGIEKQDVRHLTKSCKKLYFLKSADINLSGSKDVDQNLNKLGGMFENSKRIEEIRFHVYFCHIEPSPLEGFQRKKKRVFFKNLKSVSMKFAFKTGWASYFDGVELGYGYQVLLQLLPNIANPTLLSLTFDKIQMPLNVLEELAKMLPQLTNLQFILLEFNNIKLTEFDLMVLAKGFINCRKIQHFTFKYIDNVVIPMTDLVQFITIMAKYSAFPKLDLFFRKILPVEWEKPEVKRKLDDLGNSKYIITKQSIHIEKI